MDNKTILKLLKPKDSWVAGTIRVKAIDQNANKLTTTYAGSRPFLRLGNFLLPFNLKLAEKRLRIS